MSKIENIKEALSTNGDRMSDAQIAQVVGCSESYVYIVRNDKYYTSPKVAKKRRSQVAKEAAIARNAELGQQAKRLGRPPKPKAPLSIVEASQALMGLVRSVPDLSLSFDHDVDSVTVLWQEEMYRVNLDELPQTIESIKFLKSKEPVYESMELYYDNI